MQNTFLAPTYFPWCHAHTPHIPICLYIYLHTGVVFLYVFCVRKSLFAPINAVAYKL